MNKTGDKHYITDRILNLIKQSIDDNRGSKAAFCRITGITPYNLSKMLHGNKKFVFGDDWNRLCDYFPEIDDRPIHVAGNGNVVNGNMVIATNGIEDFRNSLISSIIMMDLDAGSKEKVLKLIATHQTSGRS